MRGDGHKTAVPSDIATAGPSLGDRLIPLLRRAARAAVDFALPPRCPGCGAITVQDQSFCAACWGTLDAMAGPACARCSLPLPDDGVPDPDRWCGRCLQHAPPYHGAPAAYAYGPVAARVALRLKYGRRPGHARLMADAMRPKLAALLAAHGEAGLPPLLIPVPLNRWRLWSRGYNQAGLLADRLGRRATNGAIEVAHDILTRPRASGSMRGQSRGARARAVRGAFAVAPGGGDRLAGRHVILVDDVHASGATLAAAARALRKAGAERVSAITWARVLPDGLGTSAAFDTGMPGTQMRA